MLSKTKNASAREWTSSYAYIDGSMAYQFLQQYTMNSQTSLMHQSSDQAQRFIVGRLPRSFTILPGRRSYMSEAGIDDVMGIPSISTSTKLSILDMLIIHAKIQSTAGKID